MNDYKELCETLRLANSWQFAPKFVNAMLDAADAIEQLAKDNDVLTKERDAAVDDLNIARSCLTCKGDGEEFCDGCDSWASKSNWEWRGVQE